MIELTAKFHDIFVNVTDQDGNYLLIEAAMTLPSWLDQATSKNRVCC